MGPRPKKQIVTTMPVKPRKVAPRIKTGKTRGK